MKTSPLFRQLRLIAILLTVTVDAFAEDASLTVRADSQTVTRAIAASMTEHDRLFKAVDLYTSKLLAGDWRAVYALWSPLFRSQSSEDDFVRVMVSSSYDVAEYDVKAFVVDFDYRAARLVVRISDSEHPPRFGIALWGKDQNEQWYCIDDGTQQIRTPRVLFGEEDLLRELTESSGDTSISNSQQNANVGLEKD